MKHLESIDVGDRVKVIHEFPYSNVVNTGDIGTILGYYEDMNDYCIEIERNNKKVYLFRYQFEKIVEDEIL
jgi:hypothetical protein